MIQQSHSWAYIWGKTLIQKDTCTPIFIVALFTIARTWKQLKCPYNGKCPYEWTSIWMDKEDVVHVYSGILLNQQKEWRKKDWNNAIYSNMDGPRDDHTKWSQTKTNIIWYHLHGESKRWLKWTYLQTRNRLTVIENKFMVTKGERGGGKDQLGVRD